jgi:NPCBM/NEW2 domain-containing protein
LVEPQLTLEAPASVEPPLTVWEVAFDSAQPDPGAPAPAFVQEVRARFAAPHGRAPDVALTIDGPGVFTPTSRTRFRRVRPGEAITASWRWAAPLRAEAPPYGLPVTVRADWGDGTVTASRTVEVRPPAPPSGDAFVSDLPFDWGRNGYGPIERDTANGELPGGDGGPLRVDGRTYEKGLGMNALGLAGFHLGGRCTRFAATVGIDDSRGGGGSVVFRVVGDGRTLFESAVVRGSTAAVPVSVDVTGVEQLDLVADPTADGQGNDHADWADARLECGS